MKIYISPMAGVTDYSYRKILKKFNSDLVFCEMVNAHLMTIEDSTTLSLLKCDDYNNTGAQVFGHNKEDIINAFLKLEQIGFKNLNLNMGCPQPKIIKSGSGSTLLPNTKFMEDLIYNLKSKLKDNTKLSIKIRIGYKDFNNPIFYIDLASKYNLDFICIHGRTQEQFYSGVSNWDLIKNLSFHTRNTNFIGNGDLTDPYDIVKKIKGVNLDGIMIARGMVGNPWLISQLKDFFKTKNIIDEVSFEEIKSTLIEHFNLLTEDKGEITSCLEINKFIKPYFSRFTNGKNPNIELQSLLKDIIIEKNFTKKYSLINSL